MIHIKKKKITVIKHVLILVLPFSSCGIRTIFLNFLNFSFFISYLGILTVPLISGY